jgi:hypothetical protein
MYAVGGKAETCARIEFFAVWPRAELAVGQPVLLDGLRAQSHEAVSAFTGRVN